MKCKKCGSVLENSGWGLDETKPIYKCPKCGKLLHICRRQRFD